MKDIAIYGAGGFGKEVAILINNLNKIEKRWNLVGFFDDGKPKGAKVSHFGEVLGDITTLNSWERPLSISIAVGSPQAIKNIRVKITNCNVDFPNIICHNFWIGDDKTFKIGQGNIIQGLCFASCDVSIGDFNVFNGENVIGHDVVIGDYNVFMPAVRVSGEVNVGNGNLFGVGSIILQQLNIGHNVRVGAGSVLMTKPKDDNLYLGVPAKIFKY